MSNPMEFLLWVRGPAFNVALAVLIIGMLVRLLEIFLLGRRTNYAEPRGGEWGPGLRTLWSRSFPDPGTFKRASFNVIVGWIWHLGFLIVLLLFIPHIELVEKTFSLSWPGLPNPLVDAICRENAIRLFELTRDGRWAG